MERRLGKNWREELILDPRPIGSGCIAVVYRGLLRLHVNEERDASHRSFLSQAYYPYESPYKEEEQLSPPPISRPVSSSERSSLSEGTLSSTFSTLSAPGESDVSSSSSSFFASPPPTLIETRAEVKKKKEEEHEGDRVRSVGNEKKKKERGEEEREDDDVWMCVAVKVVKPMTRQSMEVDLHLLCSLARFIDSLPGFQWISLTPGAEEFASTMRSQLDLKKEALHLIQFRENFGLPNPVFPLSLTRLDPISHSSTAHVKKHLRLSRDRSNFSLLSSSPSSPSTNLTSSTSSSLSPVLPSSSSDLPPSSPSDPSSSTPPSPDLSSSSFSSFSSFLSLPLLKEVISSYLPFSFFSSWGASGLPSSSSPRLLKKRSSSSSSLVVFPYPVLPLCDEEFLLMTLEQGIPLDLLLQHSAREREEERRRTRERDEEKEKRRRRRKGRGWVMRCVLGKKEEEKKDEKRENDTNAHAGEEREREEEEDGRSKRGLLKKESRERKEFVTREDEEKNVYESELVNAAQMACEQMKAEREGIGRVALHTFLKMLLLDNFLHADLHPGNILVRRGISLLPPSSSLSSSSPSSFFSSEKVVWKDEQRGMDVLTNEEEEEGREKQNKSSFSSSSSGSSQAMGLPSFTSNAPVIPLARFSLSSSSSDEIDLSPVSSKEDLHSFSASSSSLSREMKKEKRKRERGRRYRYEPYLQLIFLDCGLVAALYGDDRENFLLLLQAIALNKGIEAGELLAKVLDLSRRYQVILDSQFA
ncbi:abc1 family protein, partial [Cystoisospora suis]